MVDIESKSLNYLKNHLVSIDKISEDDVKKLINAITYIDSWDVTQKLKMYIDLIDYIINNYDINNIWFKVSSLANQLVKTTDNETKMFYAAIYDFKTFLQRIYDIYMLDQILFIVKGNFEIDVASLLLPQKTGSIYEEYRFGLDLVQVAFDSDSFWQAIDTTLYKIKKYYMDEIKEALKNEAYVERLDILKKISCMISTDPKNESYYAFDMFSYIATLNLSNKKMERKRVRPKEDDSQFTLFDN